MLRIGEIATASLPKAQIINLLQVPGGSESQQVMLQVRFAEVNRRELSEAGLDLFVRTGAVRGAVHHAAVPCARLSTTTRPGGIVFSDFLNLFFFDQQVAVSAAS